MTDSEILVVVFCYSCLFLSAAIVARSAYRQGKVTADIVIDAVSVIAMAVAYTYAILNQL